MRKYKWILLPLLLALLMILTSCGGTQTQEAAEVPETTEPSEIQEIPEAHEVPDTPETPEVTLEYRIADREEGIRLLLSNEAYYDGFTQNDLDYRMQETGASMDAYLAFAEEQVQDFTVEQEEIIRKHMDQISAVLRERGYGLPDLEPVVFVRTTMKEECGSTAYTHGTQIYIDADMLSLFSASPNGGLYLDYVFAHELFHCLTRSSPEFRTQMYRIIHFRTRGEDFELPPSVKEYFISNPDVEQHDAYATFIIDGQPVDCFAAFVTTRHFKNRGDSFFASGTTALVPVDGSDGFYLPSAAENFDEVFGRNTGYVIDPEECMADNFGYLIAYGTEGPDGKGYPDPQIVLSIEEVLKGWNG